MRDDGEGDVVDPVCGMTIRRSDAAGHVVHDGRTYYFCAPSCQERFREDPQTFLAARTPVAGRPAPAAAEYTCPMHPEVVRDRPGSCPICGMALEPRVATADDASPERAVMERRFWISAALTAPFVLLMAADLWPGMPLHGLASGRTWAWIQLCLATPVVLWGGSSFFARGYESVVHRHLNMFTLIALGTGTAYAYSLAATLAPGLFPASFRGEGGETAVYFEPAAVIVTLILLGQVLELRARERTSGAIRALLRLAPRTAHVLREAGGEEDVALEAVAPGDRLRVRPGETVPVDGVVIEGTSTIDESMVTGESMPVDKAPDAPVIGGTVNGTGSFVMEARRVGADTLLAHIVRLVGDAQRSKAPIQRLADRVAGWFVPAVIVVAVATFAIWARFGPEPRLAHALVNAVAVLIIACPCALGLATPMSIMVGTGRGAQAGVLVRNAEALERLEGVDVVVFDKTGTLTEGRPSLVRLEPAPGFEEKELLRLAASVEQVSEHPLAAAVVAAARERGIPLGEPAGFQSQTGRGVTATVEGHRVAVGNAALIDDPARALEARAAALREEGQTVVFAAVDGRPAGLLGIADRVKPAARETIAALRGEGLRLVMLTGDHSTSARAVAGHLGIDEIVAEVSPAQKVAVVKRLQDEGHRVAMAGDGINDAPALARADVGIAMGTGTDVALESADVALVKGDLGGILRARRLSRGVMRNVRQNLFFAFVYNTLGVPLAAGALYPVFGLLLSPMIASAAMTLSSVSVISNALRLRRLPL